MNQKIRLCRIKKEFLNYGESTDDLYVILEDNGDRMIITPLENDNFIGSQETVPTNTIEEIHYFTGAEHGK